jgi:hypothetical protein
MHHLEDSHFGPLAHQFDPHTFLDPGLQPSTNPEDDPDAVFSGHVLTASMPLWQKVRQEGSVKTSPDAVRRELSSLLESSYQLGLRNEIAPVQIMQLLRMRRAELKDRVITVEDLKRLANGLEQYLRCYGYVSPLVLVRPITNFLDLVRYLMNKSSDVWLWNAVRVRSSCYFVLSRLLNEWHWCHCALYIP